MFYCKFDIFYLNYLYKDGIPQCLIQKYHIPAWQTRIGARLGFWGKDCTSCRVNGPGKCDPDGCPNKATIYVKRDKQCAGKGEMKIICRGMEISNLDLPRILDSPSQVAITHVTKNN